MFSNRTSGWPYAGKKKSKTKQVKNLTQIMDLSTTYNYKISGQKQIRFPL